VAHVAPDETVRCTHHDQSDTERRYRLDRCQSSLRPGLRNWVRTVLACVVRAQYEINRTETDDRRRELRTLHYPSPWHPAMEAPTPSPAESKPRVTLPCR